MLSQDPEALWGLLREEFLLTAPFCEICHGPGYRPTSGAGKFLKIDVCKFSQAVAVSSYQLNKENTSSSLL
jgi:hypothetical protein